MVAVQPDLGEVIETAVGSDVGGAEMRVVVEDGLRLGMFVVQTARRFTVEQEIVAQECTHGIMLSTFRLLRNPEHARFFPGCDNTGLKHRCKYKGHRSEERRVGQEC